MDSTINMIKQIRSQLEEDSRMETHERVKRKREQSPEINNKRPHQKTERARERRRRKRERRRQRLLYEKKEEQRRKRPRSSDRDEAEEGESSWKRPHIDEERCDPLDISSYNFHHELGNGSFGNVMLASLPNRKKPVAIKILKKENIKLKDRYETEVKVMKLAWKCPFLCNIHAAFQTQLHAFIVMEYASGGSLQDLLNNRGYLDMDSVLFYAAEMVCGLQFLHSEGIIHRDFKPENILFSNKGHIKIADFGLAAENVFGNKTISGSIGTLHNMAPEMVQCQIYNSAVDWWAFGIVLSKMATGRSPFYEGRKAEKCINFILNCQPSYSEQLSTELQDLLEKVGASASD
ncbi:hypothetical protein XELAEV_18027320mg [Xenopus laevis]|uniref:Protein kinase domain-containing protein n=1 Tax=Xenopus laevis TaxID=8355 RepID=A0A974HJV1_XENLA|nr:hypothetical protein XELAEV_18027320mg [Xenopus laevis]